MKDKGMSRHKRVEAKLRICLQQQTVVAELGQRALMGTDLASIFDKATVLVAKNLQVEYCKVLELLPDENALLLRAGVGWREGLVGSATVGAGTNSQAGYTLLSSKPVIVKDLREEKRFSGLKLLHDHGVISGISVMIHGKDRPFGVLGAHTTRRRMFTRDDIHFLQSVSNVLAEAIERHRNEAALKESESRYRSLIQALPDIIYKIDPALIFR